MSTSHGVDRHLEGSVGHYCVLLLRGTLELHFPARPIEPPTAPSLVGPLLVLAIHPRRALAPATFKALLYEGDPELVTPSQVQTPISRLRSAGLPIPPRQYLLDVAPADVDVIDFDHRAKAFIDHITHTSRPTGADLEQLLEEGHRLDELWHEDPGTVVAGQPLQYALFERHRRRHKRFGRELVRLLVHAGDRVLAGDVLDDYVDRYGTDEDFQGLERQIRRRRRAPERQERGRADRSPYGPAARGTALAELADRLAASTHLDLSHLVVSAHNLDRIYDPGTLALNRIMRIRGAPVEAPGGAAANTAFGLAQLGRRTAAVGMVATDRYGTVLRNSLEGEQVDTTNLFVVPGSADAWTGHTMIFSDSRGQRIDFVAPGVNERLAHHLAEDKAARGRLSDSLRAARLVSMSSFTGDAERRLQEELLEELPEATVVTFAPGDFYTPLGLDRLRSFVVRSDVLHVSVEGLRELLVHSSADTRHDGSLRAMIEALYGWRAVQTGGPLVVVVRHAFWPGGADDSNDMITVAVGRGSVEDLGSAQVRGPQGPVVTDVTGVSDAIAAGVHLGLLAGAALEECVDLAFVLANEVVSEIGCRRGLPSRATIGAAWSKYFPGVDLPGWVLSPEG